MHDFEAAIWADQHLKLSDTIHQLVRETLAAFERLQHIQFDAPWRRTPVR